MQAGLDVFAMDSPEHKELKDVEKDLNLMEQVSGYRTGPEARNGFCSWARLSTTPMPHAEIGSSC